MVSATKFCLCVELDKNVIPLSDCRPNYIIHSLRITSNCIKALSHSHLTLTEHIWEKSQCGTEDSKGPKQDSVNHGVY